MRRHFWLLLSLLLGGFFLPLWISGQLFAADMVPETPLPLSSISSYPAPDPVPVTPIPIKDINGSFPAPGDNCSAAGVGPLVYPSDLLATGSANVSSYGRAVDDPVLSCLAGSLFDPKGYRSAWYRIDAPVGGILKVRTVSDFEYRRNYDTVIAIHTGDCGSLTELVCNDDNYAILSEAITPVTQGDSYFIEVVARDPSTGSLPPVLNIEAEIIPNAEWNPSQTVLPTPLTGHAVVISGTYAYIVGGITDLFSPFWTGGNRSGAVYRYDTATGEIVQLARMPAGGGAGASGYAFADAVIVNNEIHMPTGFIGADGGYDGSHWVYDISDNEWFLFSATSGRINPPWGPPPGTDVPGWAAMAPHRLGVQRGFFVTGGLRGRFRGGTEALPSNDFYQYVDIGGSLSWNVLPQMNTARYAHTAVRIVDGASYRICVVGGLTVENGGDAILEGGECYFPNGAPPTFVPGWYETVGPLNIPRYMAESVIGPDGRWYVLGGVDRNGNYVVETEVFDVNTGSWTIAAANQGLTSPRLAWTRGGFVNGVLWLFGGQQPGGPTPVPLIQSNRFALSPATLAGGFYLPIVFGESNSLESFLEAYPLTLGQPREAVFGALGDVYHIYQIDLPTTGILTVQLTNIESGHDYDLLLYDQYKRLWRTSANVGVNPEDIVQVISLDNQIGHLPPGRYYIFVARNAPNIAPSAVPYRLLATFAPD